MHLGSQKYGDDNWKSLPSRVIFNHLMRHLVLWKSGDRSEEHLSHAAANALMLTEMEECFHDDD